MSPLLARTLARPRLVIALVLGLALFSVVELARQGVQFDSSPDTLIAESHEARRLYAQAQRIFGSDRLLVIGLHTRDVFSPDFLTRLRELTRRLERFKGVERVISLTNILTIESADGVIEVKNLIPPNPSPAELRAIGRRARGHRLLRRNLLSDDGRATAITIFLSPTADIAITEEIYRVARSVAGADDVYIAGEPIMEFRGSRSMVRDLLRLLPVSLSLVVIAFALTFGQLRGVLLPLGTVALSVLLTLAVMSLVRRPITVSTLTLPVILMAIASSYVIHVLHRCWRTGDFPSESPVIREIGQEPLVRDNSPSEAASPGETDPPTFSDPEAMLALWRDRLRQALAFIQWPVIVSATTTMAGFTSLLFTGIPTSRDLGLFATCGVGIALLLALVFVPAVLVLAPPRPRAFTLTAGRLSHLLQRIARLVTRRRRAIYGVTVVVTLVSVIGLARIEINTDYLRFHPSRSELHEAARFLHEKLAGVASFHLLVDARRRGALERPEILARIVELQRQIEAQPGIDTTFSIADLVIEVNQALASGDPAQATIPDNRERVQNIFADLLSQDDMARHLMDRERSQAVILVRSHLFGSREMSRVLARIERWARANLTEVTVHPTGLFVLLNRTADDVARQQSRSLTVALTLVWFMMAALFRSSNAAMVALIPNALSILLFFGVLGWTGIPLDINTSLVASVVLGLAVDNAVHLLWRYRDERQRGIEPDIALHRALLHAGPPILVANLTLIAAFVIFGLSTFPPVRIEGVLAAMTVSASVLSNLFVLPALVAHPLVGLNLFRR